MPQYMEWISHTLLNWGSYLDLFDVTNLAMGVVMTLSGWGERRRAKKGDRRSSAKLGWFGIALGLYFFVRFFLGVL